MCECQLTIQDKLVASIEYDFIRPELFDNNTTLKDNFDNVSSDDIVIFIKRAHCTNHLHQSLEIFWTYLTSDLRLNALHLNAFKPQRTAKHITNFKIWVFNTV